MCKFEETLIVTFRTKCPFFLGTAADAKAQLLFSSELLAQFILKFATHIDGTQSQRMCKFEETLIGTFRAKYFFFLATAADAKAQPFVITYPSHSTCTH